MTIDTVTTQFMKFRFFFLLYYPVFLFGQIGSSTVSSSVLAETNDFSSSTALPEILADGKSSEECCLPVMIIIPVELLSFEGKAIDKGNQLTWTTASEINNRGFEIWSSRDAKSWKSIGFVEGAANSLGLQDYRFLDELPLKGINYYRLKQIDFDGAYEYSKIIAIDGQKTDNWVWLQSNLVQNQLSVLLADEADITIINAAGIKVQQRTINGNSTVDVTDLSTGTYHLLVVAASEMKVLRFVKQ
ncbi:MAG: T9SS type A sorting domain-containing protein [Bacteroidota bacterium]